MKANKIAIYVMSLVTLMSCSVALYTRAQEGLWKGEVLRLSQKLASWEAANDVLQDRKRLLQLEANSSELHFSGRHDGVFEIWIPEYYPSISAANRYAEEHYVEYYNQIRRGLEIRSRNKEIQSLDDDKGEAPSQSGNLTNATSPTSLETEASSPKSDFHR